MHSRACGARPLNGYTMRGTQMHYSRLCAVLIDCNNSNVDEAARFCGEALGGAVDSNHPNSHGNYRMLETPPDEPIVEIQRVEVLAIITTSVMTNCMRCNGATAPRC